MEKLESIDENDNQGELSVAMGAMDLTERNLSERESKRSFNQSMRQSPIIEKESRNTTKRDCSKSWRGIGILKSGSWIQADQFKEVLTESRQIASMKQDNEELILFLEEWNEKDKKGAGRKQLCRPDNPTRIMVEKKMLDARSNFERGAYQQSRSEMGRTRGF